LKSAPLSGVFDRRILIGLALLVMIVAALFLLNRESDSPALERRPGLLIMSSIPLQWGEATMAEVASGKAQPSPLFKRLGEKNRTVLIDDFRKLGKPGSAPVLMIQPRALAPSELVQLDDWVRKGGSAIIFADPALEWPSDLPLGDRRRPLFTSLLTPLFRHWGVELALPIAEKSVVEDAIVGEYRIGPKSAGIWLPAKNDKAAGRCTIRKDELIALCIVGRGKALLVADADLLHDGRWTDSLVTSGTMAWLQSVIDAARSSESISGHLWEIQGS
jgi:hypothetical protein